MSNHSFLLFVISLIRVRIKIKKRSIYLYQHCTRYTYGETFIYDDYFLAMVGALAALFSAVGRIIWGILADRYSVRTSFILSNDVYFTLTFNVTNLVGKELYLVYVCLLFISLSAPFVLLPTAVAKTFGTKHYGVTFGIVFTATIMTSPMSAVLTSNLQSRIGWDGMFLWSQHFPL
ncbi:LOW QUALITY PROTEIN: hypothetical protein KUTeg_012847 [Tegillarca granosa]|uniref:Major facilitator superfamily (MFS) profile domain-containing protein n=1 Tax=Tegillarca granosa TaxID=220873 RepID=A0ABQ9EWS7_TEGGR|nr:LOW QUALITY PROTEIN: hypothetical protein KUTeg_012847 [Tegillarca granosa]